MYLEAVVFCAATFVAYKLLARDKLSKIPGPKQWPVVGNTFQLHPTKPFLTLQEWAQDHGPVYKVNLGGLEAVVATGTEALHELFVKKGNEFADRFMGYRADISTFNAIDLVLRNYDEKFKWMKKFMFKGLRQHNLKNTEAITLEAVDELIRDIKELDGKSFEPSQMVFTTLFQILYVMVFSKRADKDDQNLLKLIRMDKEFSEVNAFVGGDSLLDLFPWLKYFGNKTYKRILEAITFNREVCSAFIQQAQQGEIQNSWFNELLEAHAKDPNFINEDNVVMILVDFFIAGSSTTCSTILTFLNVLAHYPEVQRNLQEEVDGVIEESGQITFSHRENMPFTYACILESLR